MKKNKHSFFSRVLMNVAPSYFLKRSIAERDLKMLLEGKTSPSTYSYKQSETKRQRGKLQPLRDDARNVFRESAYAARGIEVLVNQTVGWGIEASFQHKDQAKLQKIEAEWNSWRKSCGVNGMSFEQIQRIAMQTMLVDGEVITRIIPKDGFKLQLLDADFICDSSVESLKTDVSLEQGILCDEFGIPEYINLWNKHPGSAGAKNKLYKLGTEAIHTFKHERPHQIRGVSALYKTIEPLRLVADLHAANLERVRNQASTTAVIEKNSGTSVSLENTEREELASFENNSVYYLNPGEKINFTSPASGTPEVIQQIECSLREAAAAFGISYEALSGDYSKSSFSASRMARLETNASLDSLQWQTFIPGFIEPVFAVFKRHLALKGVDSNGLEVQWHTPQRPMLSPKDEVAATVSSIRAGLTSYSGALRELGLDPRKHAQEIQKSNQLIDNLNLILDSDPRRTDKNNGLVNPEALSVISTKQTE